MLARIRDSLSTAVALVLLAGCATESPTPGDRAGSTEAHAAVATPGAAPQNSPSEPDPRPADAATALAGIGALLALPAAPAKGAMEPDALANRVEACCWTSRDACKQCLDLVAESKRPASDLWPTLGRFLGPLRDLADLGIEGLGSTLLASPEGQTRDRVFRMAVASSRTRRGAAGRQGYRSTTLPLAPSAGEATWLLVEFPAPCPECGGTLDGPDDQGRMHLTVFFDCPDVDLDASFEVLPPASRAVWTHRLDALPATGLTLYVNDNQEPSLRATPGRESSSEGVQPETSPGPGETPPG